MKIQKSVFILVVLFLSLGLFLPLQAAPLALMKIKVHANTDGSYTYKIKLNNLGPILPELTTPADHTIFDWNTGLEYNAGDKVLDDDENIVLFGIDTGRDDISIWDIHDGHSRFEGAEEVGFLDSDNDGTPNQTIGWHLPFFGWTLDDTIRPNKKLTEISFKADARITHFIYWVGGSDDATIWIDQDIMIEDRFGIYNASRGEYSAVFFEREIHVKKLKKGRKHR